MKTTLLEKCLEANKDTFIKLCRIGIEHPHLATRVLSLLETMATLPADAADIKVFMVKMLAGDRRRVSSR
jgi:hypothetical protein